MNGLIIPFRDNIPVENRIMPIWSVPQVRWYFPCISRPYGTFGGRKAPLSTNMMSLKGQTTI